MFLDSCFDGDVSILAKIDLVEILVMKDFSGVCRFRVKVDCRCRVGEKIDSRKVANRFCKFLSTFKADV